MRRPAKPPSALAIGAVVRRGAKASSAAWLVTGGAGFLGTAVIRRLATQGATVRSFDLLEPAERLRVKGAQYVQGDVRDKEAVRAAMDGIDYVVHAAAALPIHRSRRLIREVNVEGTGNVLAAAKAAGVRGVVFTSSTAVYGLHKYHPILEDSPMKPVGPYGESKVEAERLCRGFRDQGLHVSVLRCKTFIGAGRLGVFEILFDWIRRGKRIYTIGSGKNRYQLLDLDDLIDAILLAATKPEGNDDFNLGAAEYGSIRHDIGRVIRHAKSRSRITPLPPGLSKSALFVLDKLRLSPLTRWHYGTMDRDSYVQIEKATTRLGWHPKRGNEDALVAAYDWYVQHLDQVTGKTGTTHTVAWDQKALRWLRGIS